MSLQDCRTRLCLRRRAGRDGVVAAVPRSHVPAQLAVYRPGGLAQCDAHDAPRLMGNIRIASSARSAGLARVSLASTTITASRDGTYHSADLKPGRNPPWPQMVVR